MPPELKITEEFVHNGVTYLITWRPKPNVLYTMSRGGKAMNEREALLAGRAFRRKNADRIDAARKVNMH